ncbi:MAG: phosphoribosylglycinamide formyltransferase [Bacillota bacterium]
MSKMQVGVLASGRGSNLQALLDAQGPAGPARVAAVISDNPEAEALDRARSAQVPAHVVLRRDYATREAHEAAIVELLQSHGVQLVALAGYMRMTGSTLRDAFPWAVLNIHPSLLPAFPGLEAQGQALRHGVKVSGCTVHFVDEGMDTGPIILQEAVPVLEADDVPALAARILAAEHRLYPQAVALFAQGRLKLEGRRVSILPGEVGTHA